MQSADSPNCMTLLLIYLCFISYDFNTVSLASAIRFVKIKGWAASFNVVIALLSLTRGRQSSAYPERGVQGVTTHTAHTLHYVYWLCDEQCYQLQRQFRKSFFNQIEIINIQKNAVTLTLNFPKSMWTSHYLLILAWEGWQTIQSCKICFCIYFNLCQTNKSISYIITWRCERGCNAAGELEKTVVMWRELVWNFLFSISKTFCSAFKEGTV